MPTAAETQAPTWRRILDLERAMEAVTDGGSRRPRFVRAEFGWSMLRYWMELARVLDSPEAIGAEPALVLRLRRVREERRAKRTARRLDDDQTEPQPGPWNGQLVFDVRSPTPEADGVEQPGHRTRAPNEPARAGQDTPRREPAPPSSSLQEADARDLGQLRALEAEDRAGQWRAEALAWIEAQPPGACFTSEDVRRGAGDPVHGNAMGGLLSGARRAGFIVSTGRMVPAQRTGMHLTDLREWERR